MIPRLSNEDQSTDIFSGKSGSHGFRFGISIDAEMDMPEGFRITIPRNSWRKAIFIPGDLTWALRSQAIPSRIYVLTIDELGVFEHDASNERPFTTKFSELIEVCSSKEAQSGVIDFATSGPSRRFRYYPAQHQCIDPFLRALRSLWLQSEGIRSQTTGQPEEMDALSLSLRFVLENELDPGESIVRMLVQSRATQNRFWTLIRHTQDWDLSCVLLTNRRLIWLTSIEGRTHCPSKVQLRYVRPEHIAAICDDAGKANSGPLDLEVRFTNASTWRLSVSRDQYSSLWGLLNRASRGDSLRGG